MENYDDIIELIDILDRKEREYGVNIIYLNLLDSLNPQNLSNLIALMDFHDFKLSLDEHTKIASKEYKRQLDRFEKKYMPAIYDRRKRIEKGEYVRPIY